MIDGAAVNAVIGIAKVWGNVSETCNLDPSTNVYGKWLLHIFIDNKGLIHVLT